MQKRTLKILGTRGIPAQHGGFETFAEHLALYLVEQGWSVTVYCQEDSGKEIFEDHWKGVRRVRVPVSAKGALGTVVFDLKSTRHAAREPGLALTLGYNTAVFSLLLRLSGIKNLINMDGIEWKRDKWRFPERVWLYANERLGCWLGNHLIADHPEIKRHLERRVKSDKITMIPYGADPVSDPELDELGRLGLEPGRYALVIARPEPENSVLEIVRAYSRKPRGMPLVVLGNYDVDANVYHREVVDCAGPEVRFLGAVYQKSIVESLRGHCRLYLHGHTVGGTNPSLVEALGAESPVLAHDNPFNRWVAGEGGRFFRNEDECAQLLDELLEDDSTLKEMSKAAYGRYLETFTWDKVLDQYEQLLAEWI